jgi:hypothetical protein
MGEMMPLCGAPMRRNERAGAVLEDPVCGRPPHGPGTPHRSEAALARNRRAQKERRAPVQAAQNRRRRTRRLHERLAPVVEAAAARAREGYRRAA